MKHLPADETCIYLPRTFRCPHCDDGGRLFVEIDEWDDDGIPTECGVHVSCVNEDDDHWVMPYVTLLPLEERAYAWCVLNVRIIESEAETLAKLAAWNAGEPIREAN